MRMRSVLVGLSAAGLAMACSLQSAWAGCSCGRAGDDPSTAGLARGLILGACVLLAAPAALVTAGVLVYRANIPAEGDAGEEERTSLYS